MEPRFSSNRAPRDDALRRTPDTYVAKSEELAALVKFKMRNWITGLNCLNIDLDALGPTSLKKPQCDI